MDIDNSTGDMSRSPNNPTCTTHNYKHHLNERIDDETINDDTWLNNDDDTWFDRNNGNMQPRANTHPTTTTTTTTTTTPEPCPATDEGIRANGGCCVDYDPLCPTPRLCRLGGCVNDTWLEGCIYQGTPRPDLVCEAPSVALAAMGIDAITTTTTTTTTHFWTPWDSGPLHPPLGPAGCPQSIDEIQQNNGCCSDMPGQQVCEFTLMCTDGGCYRDPPSRSRPTKCLGILCPSPRQALIALGTDEAMAPIREAERQAEERAAAEREERRLREATEAAARVMADAEAERVSRDARQADEDQETQLEEREFEAARMEEQERQDSRHAAAAALAHTTAIPNSGAVGMMSESWVFPVFVALSLLR